MFVCRRCGFASGRHILICSERFKLCCPPKLTQTSENNQSFFPSNGDAFPPSPISKRPCQWRRRFRLLHESDETAVVPSSPAFELASTSPTHRVWMQISNFAVLSLKRIQCVDDLRSGRFALGCQVHASRVGTLQASVLEICLRLEHNPSVRHHLIPNASKRN